MSTEAFDREFRDVTRARLARYANNYRVVYGHHDDLDAAKAAAQAAPRDAQAQARLAAALVNAGQLGDARASADAALAIDPRNRMALFIRSDVALQGHDMGIAKHSAEALLATGIDSYEMRINLAHAAEAQRDRVALRRQLEAAKRLDPSQREPHERLAELAAQEGRGDDELQELVAVARIDQHDRRIYQAVIEKLAALGRWQDVRSFAEMDLYLDPLSADLHRTLATAYERLGQRPQALFELETALLCHPRDEAEIRAALARLRGGGGARH